MIEFVKNKENGILEVWKNGIKIGVITTMDDKINKKENNFKNFRQTYVHSLKT